MIRLQTFLTRMIIFLAIVVGVVGLLFDVVARAFMSNPALNGLILGVLLLGIAYSFRQVLRLSPEFRWMETYRRNQPGLSVQAPPRLLSPMANMLGERGGRVTLSAVSMRTLLDSIGARLDESRDISRYLIGLLIFLGLLGTFWGLLETINSVGGVIQGLSVGQGDFVTVFNDLKAGLQAPLGGMGTAFSSSLFGLAGSLVLGFLDLQGSQAQNRFFNELEEWLSGLTRITGGPLTGDGSQPISAYVNALLEQTADSLESLQRTLARSEESRRSADDKILHLTEKLATLTDQMRAEQTLMVKLVENQLDMKPVLSRLSELVGQEAGAIDEASRAHLRNIDVYVTKLLEETVSGREQTVETLRSEIKLLARTVAALSDQRKMS